MSDTSQTTRGAAARAARRRYAADRATDAIIGRLAIISDEKLATLVRAAWAEVNRRDPVGADDDARGN